MDFYKPFVSILKVAPFSLECVYVGDVDFLFIYCSTSRVDGDNESIFSTIDEWFQIFVFLE